MADVHQAVFSTLIYADIFDYPLTSSEIWRFLIAQRKMSLTQVTKAINELKRSKFTGGSHDYCFISGRKKIVAFRQRRARWGSRKLRLARKVAGWFSLIPWVRMVGVTGSLAMANSDKEDDIDLLVVAASNRLWLTRLLVTLLVGLVAKRRRVGDKKVRDKICLNMFLEENHLQIPKKEQDLYSAHEVVQFKPLWEKDGTYQKFISANQWVKKYLPNALEIKKIRNREIENKTQRPIFFNYSITQLLNYGERITFRLQLWYMRSRRTTEVVGPHRIRFHPHDCRQWILERYQQNLGKQMMNHEIR